MFKINQEVTPIKTKFNMVFGEPLLANEKPVFGRVYTVAGYFQVTWKGLYFMFLKEFPEDCLYCERGFAPLISDEELDEALKTESEMAEA